MAYNLKKSGLAFLAVLVFIFSFSLASSAGIWNYWGGSPWNAQTSNEGSIYGLFNTGFQKYSENIAIGTNFQPIIANFSDIGGLNYIIETKGNYLYLLDAVNLSMKKEYLVGGTQVRTLSLGDFDGDGFDEIMGIFNVSGLDKLLAFKYNATVNGFSLIYNYTLSSIVQSDIKCGRWLDSSNTHAVCVFAETIGTRTNMTFINISTTSGNINTCNFRSGTYNYGASASSPSIYLRSPSNYFLFFGTESSQGHGAIDAIYANCTSIYSRNFPQSGNPYYGGITANWYPFYGELKIAYAYEYQSATNCYDYLYLINLDGGTFWSNTYNTGSCGSIDNNLVNLNTYGGDFNGDGINDIWLIEGITTVQRRIFSGQTGNILNSTTDSKAVKNTLLADMNGNGINDWIFNGSVINSQTGVTLSSVGSGYSWCIPSDISPDGFLDLLCSGSVNGTALYLSNYTNQNAHITSVTYDPSTTIAQNSYLYMYVTASDVENNPIYCSVDCFGNGTYTSDSGTTQSCFYSGVGLYNNTIRCRDYYHSDYGSYLSHNILVTQFGVTCNNNGICDSGIGETSSNCPSDCQISNQYTSSNETGGMPLPVQLVDTTQEYAIGSEQGLLPEIYYGTLGFLSNSLSPMIALVFLFFIVMIMVAIGYFIKNISRKIAGNR